MKTKTWIYNFPCVLLDFVWICTWFRRLQFEKFQSPSFWLYFRTSSCNLISDLREHSQSQCAGFVLMFNTFLLIVSYIRCAGVFGSQDQYQVTQLPSPWTQSHFPSANLGESQLPFTYPLRTLRYWISWKNRQTFTLGSHGWGYLCASYIVQCEGHTKLIHVTLTFMANQTHFLINPFTFVFVMVVMLPSLASFEIERDDFLLGCDFGESFKRKFKKPFLVRSCTDSK